MSDKTNDILPLDHPQMRAAAMDWLSGSMRAVTPEQLFLAVLPHFVKKYPNVENVLGRAADAAYEMHICLTKYNKYLAEGHFPLDSQTPEEAMRNLPDGAGALAKTFIAAHGQPEFDECGNMTWKGPQGEISMTNYGVVAFKADATLREKP
jgi:hypothetical protein